MELFFFGGYYSVEDVETKVITEIIITHAMEVGDTMIMVDVIVVIMKVHLYLVLLKVVILVIINNHHHHLHHHKIMIIMVEWIILNEGYVAQK